MSKQPAVYILSSRRKGILYVGVNSNLTKRVWEHRNNLVEGFTKRYGVHQMVWYELHKRMDSAIKRAKRLKDWKRKWKVQLIEHTNPNWEDLVFCDYLTGFRLKDCRNDAVDVCLDDVTDRLALMPVKGEETEKNPRLENRVAPGLAPTSR